MHFALFTAPTVTEFRAREEILSRAVQQAALQPQLGILNVAAVLEQWGDQPHLLDVNAEYLRFAASVDERRIDEFAHHLAEVAVRTNADVYGFSSICSTFPLSLRVATAVKQLRPYATILFGGPQASVVDEAVLQKFPAVDFVLRGEVEKSLPVFVDQLFGDSRFSDVPGLTYRDGAHVRRTANAAVIDDLDTLPAAAYHLSKYLQNSKSASIELGRGCPFSCTFCSTNDFFRRRFRLRSPERVLAEMRSISEQYGIRHFELVHDMFTVDRKRVIAFCDVMRGAGEEFTWDCSARTDCVDDELLQHMAASGCRGLFFGIESGSVRMQRIIDKDLDPAKAERVLDTCERLGIRTTASLIVGFPEENWTDVADTLRIYMKSARCVDSHPQLNLLAPLAGTALHTEYGDHLTFADFSSSMSHQGLRLADEDTDLIRMHPEIFPNFYTLPAPGLDLRTLFHLREFLSMAVEHYRWLLCAIAQRVELLHFHKQWLAWRGESYALEGSGDLRRYYASAASRSDFLDFMGTGELRADPVVGALLHVERTLILARELSPTVSESGEPRLADHVRVVELNYDLASLLKATAAEEEPVTAQCFYATRADSEQNVKLHRISAFLATVLDNQLDRIASCLREEFGLHEAFDVSMLAGELMNQLHRDGWVTLSRPQDLSDQESP
ncbi:B12-binding domain-containing radical SAM protein [Terriglobus sp.]|uniref:B12-binding domain-containing radical SAM protein n=1 Tax=Terriglobus sp. TaxID=1889013 RepID=UPI003B0052EF